MCIQIVFELFSFQRNFYSFYEKKLHYFIILSNQYIPVYTTMNQYILVPKYS